MDILNIEIFIPESLYEGITDEPKFENAFEVMRSLVEAYNDDEIIRKSIFPFIQKYVSALNQKAIVKQLLPIEKRRCLIQIKIMLRAQ